VSFAAITLCVASQRVFIVVNIYFVINSVRKPMDTPSYIISETRCDPVMQERDTDFHRNLVDQQQCTPHD